MNGQYPRFKNSYFYEELTENFLLTPAELEFVRNCRGKANRQGMAILLKALEYLGCFPENLQQVPPSIRSFVGKQLGLLTDFMNQYPILGKPVPASGIWLRFANSRVGVP